jgi:hypothetical protein
VKKRNHSIKNSIKTDANGVTPVNSDSGKEIIPGQATALPGYSLWRQSSEVNAVSLSIMRKFSEQSAGESRYPIDVKISSGLRLSPLRHEVEQLSQYWRTPAGRTLIA